MSTISTENTPKQLKYCKYCSSKLKEIVYEIIELDKTSYFERYFCDKCRKMFYFREPSLKSTKKKKVKKLKQTTKKTKT